VITAPSPPSAPVGPVDDRVCWSTVTGLVLIHVLGVVGLVWFILHPSVPTLVLTIILYAASGVSITAGYHRLFAHRTYRARAPFRWFLLVFGAGSMQNSALSWSADHRAHHADTDGTGDPHAITRGAWFAHVGWLARRREASADVSRLTDLWSVRSVRLQHRAYAPVAVGAGLVLPALIAWSWGDPWGGLLVAGFLRVALLLQATFCVNSLTHMVGRPRYDTGSSARDSALAALVTFGEGYHSFHHRFPFDYRNGARWWQYDPSKWLIWTLSQAGQTTRLRKASKASIAAAVSAPRARAVTEAGAYGRGSPGVVTGEPLAADGSSSRRAAR
jgi:stearoyl-CoA desaturase (Delta-9 desaturase)